jgi:aspergillopepsin I
MQYFLTSAALVASASLSLAAPANQHIRRGTFEVKQVAHGKVFKNGPQNMLNTYKKIAHVGAVAPSEVVIAAAAAQTGEVSATPQQYDQAYLCPVTVGSNQLMLDFDTGSADL